MTPGALLIADEVLTGFVDAVIGPPAKRAGIQPDLMALSKGLTGGCLPMGVTMASERIFSGFIGSDPSLTLWHGHSFTANPLAVPRPMPALTFLSRTATVPRVRGQPSPASGTTPEAPPRQALPPDRHRGGLRSQRCGGDAGLSQSSRADHQTDRHGAWGVFKAPGTGGTCCLLYASGCAA